MNWTITITAIATVVSTLAYIITALYIRAELLGIEKDRYINVTSELFKIWQDPDFMKAQLWLIHRMEETSWAQFIAKHSADYGEVAFHRVGSYYDRVGTLVKLKLINEQEILSTVGGHAIAVWQRIESLVREARAIENSVLFDDYEALLPACYECYVPALGEGAVVKPFEIDHTAPKITPRALKKKLDRSEKITVLDVRQPSHVAEDGRQLPGAIRIPPDEIERRYGEIPKDVDVTAYCT